MPRITDKTLGDACSNGDGTYDGRKLVRWLFEATTGKEMSAEDADKLIEEAKQIAAKRRAEKGP